MTVSEARIILHFDVHEPIELMELTLSFGSLAKQYRRFLMQKARDTGNKVGDDEVKLYITKIENNCILAELAGAVTILGSLLPLMNYTNIFVEFVRNIDTSIKYFSALSKRDDRIDPSEIPYTKTECGDLANFLKVVSQNIGGKLGISVAEYASGNEDTKKQHVRFTFSNEEAFEAQKGALIAQRTLEYRGDADYPNTLMYFHQTNIEDPKAQGRTGDKAIIKAISEKPLPVYFISDLDKDRVKSFVDDPNLNPFRASYRVDVNVETDRNDTPKFYRILRLHEIIPDENDDS